MNEILLNVLSIIVTSVIVPLITWGGTELIKFIQTKTKNAKASELLTLATNIVTNAVRSVFQTYVGSLKADGKFDSTAQITALNKAKEIVIQQVNADLKTYIETNYGDFDNWLTNQIESTIDFLKNQ